MGKKPITENMDNAIRNGFFYAFERVERHIENNTRSKESIFESLSSALDNSISEFCATSNEGLEVLTNTLIEWITYDKYAVEKWASEDSKKAIIELSEHLKKNV